MEQTWNEVIQDLASERAMLRATIERLKKECTDLQAELAFCKGRLSEIDNQRKEETEKDAEVQ